MAHWVWKENPKLWFICARDQLPRSIHGAFAEYVRAPWMLNVIHRFCHTESSFSKKVYFRKPVPCIIAGWFHRRIVWINCCPDQLKRVRTISSEKHSKEHPRTVKKPTSYYMIEQDGNIFIPKLQQLTSWVPKNLQYQWCQHKHKEEVMQHSNKHCVIIFKMGKYLNMSVFIVPFPSEEIKLCLNHCILFVITIYFAL